MMLRQTYRTVCVCCVGALVLAGCGSKPTGPVRIVVTGKVEQGGKPVAAGLISFLPKEGVNGPAANTAISKGAYSFTKETGPVAGPHKVMITLSPASKEFATAPPPGTRPAPAPKSTWEFEVTVPDKGPFEKSFTLE